jgi:hypothetical protein
LKVFLIAKRRRIMKKISVLFSFMVLLALVMTACSRAPEPQPTQPAAAQPPTTQPPVAAPPTAEAVNPTSPTEAAAAPVPGQHTSLPGNDLPPDTGLHIGDQNIHSGPTPVRALEGDRFTLGRFERPYNANTMDVYFQDLDLTDLNFYLDETWVYAVITVIGPDANNAFPGRYAVEVDLDMDGRGDLLVLVAQPSSAEWTTDRVQVWEDGNGDVGGDNVVNADSAGRGDGYEVLVFDQGQGNDPDAAWVRLAPDNPNSIQIAFKQSLLGGDSTYLAGAWAGKDNLDSALFDLNDHFTHEQAGAANPTIANFYPIKELSELDNTCRMAVGFTPSGSEPAVCPVQ